MPFAESELKKMIIFYENYCLDLNSRHLLTHIVFKKVKIITCNCI